MTRTPLAPAWVTESSRRPQGKLVRLAAAKLRIRMQRKASIGLPEPIRVSLSGRMAGPNASAHSGALALTRPPALQGHERLRSGGVTCHARWQPHLQSFMPTSPHRTAPHTTRQPAATHLHASESILRSHSQPHRLLPGRPLNAPRPRAMWRARRHLALDRMLHACPCSIANRWLPVCLPSVHDKCQVDRGQPTFDGQDTPIGPSGAPATS